MIDEAQGRKRTEDPSAVPYETEPQLVTQWASEASSRMPTSSDWIDLYVELRWAVELKRREKLESFLPDGMTAPELSLRAVINFLQKQPLVMKNSVSFPLLDLHGAIYDLSIGKISSIFKPKKSKRGNPGRSQQDALVVGLAARTMSLLMNPIGDSEMEAARRVARALGRRYSATKVRHWRARLNEGPREREFDTAFAHYEEPLPPGEPHAQAEFLLRRLKERIALS